MYLPLSYSEKRNYPFENWLNNKKKKKKRTKGVVRDTTFITGWERENLGS